MASYAEYVKKQDNLDAEIDSAARGSQDRKDNPDSAIPERFRGKTPEEIAQSYVELEKKFSQQGNDLGVLRKTVDEFISLKSNATAQTDLDGQSATTTLDELYKDPEEAIGKVVERKAGERIESIERQLAERRALEDVAQLDADFPGWRAESQRPEFSEWVQKDPIRMQTALLASQQGNAAAARSIVATWYEVQSAVTAADKAARERALRDASLETGGGVHGGGEVKTYSRSVLIEKRIAAKRGDYAAEKFLADNRESIAIAYEQGRISD